MNTLATLFVALAFSFTGIAHAQAEAMTAFPTGIYKGEYKYPKRDGSEGTAIMTVSPVAREPRVLRIHVQSLSGTGGAQFIQLKFEADGTCIQDRPGTTKESLYSGTCVDNKVTLRATYGPSDYVETEYKWEGNSFSYRSKSVIGSVPEYVSITEAKLPKISE